MRTQDFATGYRIQDLSFAREFVPSRPLNLNPVVLMKLDEMNSVGNNGTIGLILFVLTNSSGIFKLMNNICKKRMTRNFEKLSEYLNSVIVHKLQRDMDTKNATF